MTKQHNGKKVKKGEFTEEQIQIMNVWNVWEDVHILLSLEVQVKVTYQTSNH